MIVESKDRACENIVQAVDVSRIYSLGLCEHQALQGVDFKLKKSGFAAIAGPSGSGKSTLLNILGCLERPSRGDVLIEGISTQNFSTAELADFRSRHLGFIFQTFNLIPTLSALENVEYPLLLLKLTAKDRRLKAEEALVKVGLEKFLKSRPNQMSGGQRQRVAIARAIVKRPVLILADEPTANLDQKTAREILDLMQKLNIEDGISVLFSSHDGEVLKRASSVTYLLDGKVLTPEERGNLHVA
jgi:putative ABC transport system ATP-binding protein